MRIKREINGKTYEFTLTYDEVDNVIRERDYQDVMAYLTNNPWRLLRYNDGEMRRIRSHPEEIADQYTKRRIASYYNNLRDENIEAAIDYLLKEGWI